MSTPNEEIEKIVSRLALYAPIARGGRSHTCESWNGLGDEHEGTAMLDESWKETARKALTTFATAVREKERERIEKIREKIQALDTFDSGEFGSGYLNAQSDAIMILDEALTPLPTKDSI